MPRLQKCASARKKRASLAARGNMASNGHHDDDDDFMDPPPRLNVPAKFTPPTSRCTPISISNIVKSFNTDKKKLVREMSFGGMLKLPDIVNNKEFSHWTLSRVSVDDVAIRLEDGSLLPFCEEDVHKVLDIPCTGKEFLMPSNDEIASIKQIICDRFKVTDYKNINRALLDDILTKQYQSPMSEDDKAAFKTAFIMLVMTKFLAPQALLDNICPRYFPALRDLNDIPNWNWARYVISDIISAARALGNKMSDEVRCSYINGCVIFLQVFYLDNVDFGHLNLKHDKFPRIVDYGRDALTLRRNLDIKEKDPYKPTQFGKLQLREINDVCYGSRTSSVAPACSGAGPSHDVLDGNQMVQNAKQIIQQSTVLKNMWVSCIAQIDKATNDLVKVTETAKIISSLDSVSINTDILSDGNNPQASYQQLSGCPGNQNANNPKSGETSAHKASTSGTFVVPKREELIIDSDSKASIDLNRSVNLMQDTGSNMSTANPRQLLRDMEVPSFDLHFETTPEKDNSNKGGPLSPRSLSREIAASSCIILEDMKMENNNVELNHDMYIEDSNGELKYVRGIKREYPEPRLLDFGLSTQDNTQRQRLKSSTSAAFNLTPPVRVRPEHISSVLIDWIKNCQTDDTLRSSWVAHPYPTPLKLTGMDIRNFIGGNDRVDYPTMMLYTRRLLQKDDDKFSKVHYLEADFAVHAIAGGSLWNAEMFRNQFTGPKILYDVSKCENIYVQLCDANHWNCYAFNLRQHVIHILDSSKTGKNDDVQPGSKHHWIVPMLAQAMQDCLSLFFPDWTEDVTKWDYKEPVVPTQSFEVESGAYTIELMKNWNGTVCTRELNSGCMDKVRTDIVLDILTLKENTASPPFFVKELIRQYSLGVI